MDRNTVSGELGGGNRLSEKYHLSLWDMEFSPRKVDEGY